MNTLEDLRDTFEENAGPPADTVTMVRQARAGAARIRRRRRVGTAAATAVLVAAAAMVVPFAMSRLRADGPTPAAVPYDRKPSELTIGVDPAAGLSAYVAGTNGAMQYLAVRLDFDPQIECCEIRVWDPGSYPGAAQLKKGKRVTVNGHRAWFGDVVVSGPQQSATVVTMTVITVGWQETSGAWVTVYDAIGSRGADRVRNKEMLLKVARAVGLSPPRGIPVPFHFPNVPDDRAVSYVAEQRPDPTAKSHTQAMYFGGGRKPNIDLFKPWLAYAPNPMQVHVWTVGTGNWNDVLARPRTMASNLTIGTYPAWYYEGAGTGSRLLVNAGTCGLEIDVEDRKAITKAELVRMVETATFDSCTDEHTWRPF